MKTTIDISDALYRQAKIRAVETGQTLKQIVLTSLEKELNPAATVAEEPGSYWANRKLVPGSRNIGNPERSKAVPTRPKSFQRVATEDDLRLSRPIRQFLDLGLKPW